MTPILKQQQALLTEKLRVLARLQAGLKWSLERLPPLTEQNASDPVVSERIAAIVDRFTKLQDQLASALRHAHNMQGEKMRTFNDVITWAVKQGIFTDNTTWLELRSLRNRLTHEYDLASELLPELIALVRNAQETLVVSTQQFEALCQTLQLVER